MIECGNDNGPEITTGDLHLRLVIEADGCISPTGLTVPMESKEMGCRVIRVADNPGMSRVDLDRLVATFLMEAAIDLYPTVKDLI